MTDQHDSILALAKSYFAMWSNSDFEGARALLADDVSIVLPNSGGSSPEPAFVFNGVESAVGYLQFAMSIFTSITFDDEQWFVSDDDRTVHLHARGDMTTRDGKPYTNVYVFRITVDDGKITHVDEYTNPIIWQDLGVS
ncbi:nuclear transport factor 2 family protein [Agreia sp.]|uniref:nuclear transport factor 2 family protein n=1 Tax=Agreia sp. TaxID=1872416 RepID=UPI0035BC37E4